MVRDALRGYMSLATGLSDVTVARATTAARALVAQGEATAEQVTSIADDLMASSRRNREAIVTLIRYEVDQALRRVGLAPAEEVATLTERVRRLEAALRDAQASAQAPAARAATKRAATKKAATKKAATKKSATKRAATKKSATKRAAPKRAAAKTSAAKTTSRSGSRA